MTVGVIGESLVDVVTDADGAVVERPGGSPFNVAVGLSRLGIDTRLFTAVGDDARGRSLLRHLRDEGVDVTCGKAAAATAVAVATFDAHARASYTFEIDWDPRLPVQSPPMKALHFGSLGALIAPGAHEVAAIVDAARRTALISYDPNWRDGVVGGEPRQLVETNAARADVVKLSDHDAASIYPGVELEDVARTLLDLGPSLVVITRGADGASAWTGKAVKHCDGASARVVDTVGAGDAFMAALLSEVGELGRDGVAALGKRELELVLDFSCFVAARTCERVGADPPYITDLY